MSEPFYIFNNSWYVDYNITGRRMGWWNDHIVHFNNAYFLEGIDTFGIHSSGEDSYYDYDCSSAVFPNFMKTNGYESHGIKQSPMFRDPLGNNFRLKDASPCLESGQIYEGLVEDFDGSAPDIGAYEGNKLIKGPAFKFSVPEAEIPFSEHPRITRFKVTDKSLILWFSVPMDSKQLMKSRPVIQTGNIAIPAKVESIEDNGYCIKLELETEVNPESGLNTESDLVLVMSDWPAGMNGMMMTAWASALMVSVKH